MSDDLLVADVGGTNVRLGLAEPGGGGLRAVERYSCAEFESPAAAIRAYLARSGAPDVGRAVLAVAAPVAGDRIDLTNRGWTFSTAALESELGLDRLVVDNDFTALALGLPFLGRDGTQSIKGGAAVADAPLALLGAGTGLGVSGLVPHDDGWLPLASEGGHADLAATTEEEWHVVRRLADRFGHASLERAISGPGLTAIHLALCERAGLTATAGQSVEPARIVELARGGDAMARRTLSLFSGWLGAIGGDLVLTLGARGGLFLGGGVLAHLGRQFDRPRFVDRFLAKGRFRSYLEPVPVRAIVDPNAALRGAARAL